MSAVKNFLLVNIIIVSIMHARGTEKTFEVCPFSDLCSIRIMTGQQGCRQFRENTDQICICQGPSVHQIPSILSNTTKLVLKNTSISSLPDDVFSNLTSLQHLCLNDNHHVTHMGNAVFRGLKNLINLYLVNLLNGTNADGDPQAVTLTNETFSYLPNLQNLSLHGWVGYGQDHLRNLRSILSGLQFTNISHLDLSYVNDIKSKGILWLVQHPWFENLNSTKLSSLKLSSNLIVSINSEVFTQLTYLEYLNLCNNSFMLGDFDMMVMNLPQMVNLKRMYFNYQLYTHYHRHATVKDNNQNAMITGLTRPSLSAVLSDDLNCSSYIHLPPNLTYLDISHRRMLVHSTEMTSLCICSENKLLYLDASYFWLNHFIFYSMGSLPYLRTLKLDKSLGVFKNPRFFSDLPSLTYLSMAGCQLNYILTNSTWGEFMIYTNMPNLTTLNISLNYLPCMPRHFFLKFPKLQTVQMNNNRLTELDFDFSNSLQLKKLSLVYNRIRKIPPDVQIQLASIAKTTKLRLDLLHNSLSCTCEDIDFLYWAATSYVRISGITCWVQEKYKIYTQEEFFTLIKNCNIGFELYSFGVYAFVVLVIISVAVGYRHRWRVMYLWYFSKTLFRRTQVEQRERHVMYDGFVCYNSDDLDWVDGELRRKLEDELGYQLCLHDRNFVPGVAINDNILQAFTLSNRILLVVSAAALAGRYFNFEVHIAHQQRHSRVVCILLDDIAVLRRHHLSTALEYLLKNNTYLVWPNNREGEPLFWLRLRDAMGEAKFGPKNAFDSCLLPFHVNEIRRKVNLNKAV